MQRVKKMAVVPYTDKQLFDLVNNVQDYPDFLPFCAKSEVVSQDESHLCACLTFAKGGIEKSFTTRNTLTPYEYMEVHLVDGPFKRMEGFWKFVALADGHCRIEFELDYEFNSRMLSMVFGPLFNQVASTLVDTFVKRADDIYAKG